jgi:anthranilate phosphoribosyltransferase
MFVGRTPDSDRSISALDTIMTGQATDSQIAGLMIALRAKGETVDELVGFARTMREHGVKVSIEDPDAIDMCGTGGDSSGTFNISTVASFVLLRAPASPLQNMAIVLFQVKAAVRMCSRHWV